MRAFLDTLDEEAFGTATAAKPNFTEERFGVKPDWIAADTAYGSEDNLVWLALKRQILPFIPVFDKGERMDGTFSRSDCTEAT